MQSTQSPSSEPSIQSIPESAKDLSYRVQIRNNHVEFKLTNKGTVSHLFYGDPFTIKGAGVPLHAEIQVLKPDDTLLDSWNSSIPGDSWSPIFMTSDTKQAIPAKSQTLKPGETRSLVVPIENFFAMSDFEPKAEGYRVRVLGFLHLDEKCTQYIRSRSDWVPLKPEKSAKHL